MQSMTFETNILNEFIRTPNYEQFKKKHVRIVIEEVATESGLTPNELDECFDAFNLDLGCFRLTEKKRMTAKTFVDTNVLLYLLSDDQRQSYSCHCFGK